MLRYNLQHIKAWEKLILFITACILSSMLFSLIAMALVGPLFGIDPYSQNELLDLTKLESIRSIKMINFFFQLGGFLLPAVVFSKFFSNTSETYLPFNKLPTIKQFGMLLLFFLALVIFNTWLTEVNGYLDLSFISEELQDKIVYDEALIKKSIYAYIGLSWKSYFLNLFLLAAVPAICEELVFRGILQHLFVKATRKIHLSIWVTAFIFAFIHFQFLDFLPRMALGLIFGYLVALTGSLWSSIFLHFLNNGFALSLEYFSRKGLIDLSTSWLSFGIVHLLIALVIGTLIFYWYTRNSKWNEMKFMYLK